MRRRWTRSLASKLGMGPRLYTSLQRVGLGFYLGGKLENQRPILVRAEFG